MMQGFRVIDGQAGTYHGEWQTTESKSLAPHGRGLLNCKDKLILGFTEAGKWVIGSWKIVVEKISKEFKVVRQVKARPDGFVFELGSTFNGNGLSASGIFKNSKLIYAHEIPNQSSGFMSFSGKYTLE